MYDLIIIGGGPAGLTAAIYAIRKRLDVLLISTDLGGKTNFQMTLPWIEMHQVIRGVELVERFRRELEYLDFTCRLTAVKYIIKMEAGFAVTLADETILTSKSLILATGSRVKRLNVPGEREYAGRGLTYSAMSYAPLFVGRQATVIGAGRLALRATAELAQVAATVHLIAPSHGILDAPFAQKIVSDGQKVVVLEGYKVKQIEGNGYVERVLLESPQGQETRLDTEGVFVELGLLPNSDLVAELAHLDDQGRVIVDNYNRTHCAGLFAAGDVTNAFAEQVLVAIGEGAKAALSAYEYLLATF